MLFFGLCLDPEISGKISCGFLISAPYILTMMTEAMTKNASFPPANVECNKELRLF